MCFDACFRQAGDDGEPTTSAWQGGSCHWVPGWARIYIGDLSLSSHPIYFNSLCSFCDLLGKQAEGRRPIKHPFKNSLYFMLVLLHSCYWGLWHEGHVILLSFSVCWESTNKPLKKKTFTKKYYCWPNFMKDCVAVACFLVLPQGNKKEISIFEWFSLKWSMRYCLQHENCPLLGLRISLSLSKSTKYGKPWRTLALVPLLGDAHGWQLLCRKGKLPLSLLKGELLHRCKSSSLQRDCR